MQRQDRLPPSGQHGLSVLEPFPARNLGNSCYAIIVLQLLRTCDDVLENLRYHQCCVPSTRSACSAYAHTCLLCQLRQDFAMTEPMVPSIIADIGRFNTEEVSFSRGRQEDAHEFGMALSDEINENPAAQLQSQLQNRRKASLEGCCQYSLLGLEMKIQPPSPRINRNSTSQLHSQLRKH